MSPTVSHGCWLIDAVCNSRLKQQLRAEASDPPYRIVRCVVGYYYGAVETRALQYSQSVPEAYT